MNVVETKRILVCDDTVDIADSVSQLLKCEGYESAAVYSAQQCLEHIELNPPHLLILDVRMPEKDGFWLAETLEARGFRIPIIFLTAHDRPIYRIYAPVVGAAEFLIKPYDPAALVSAVERTLQRSARSEGWIPRRKSGPYKAVDKE